MKERLESIIREFVETYNKSNDVKTKWKEPLITYADAEDSMFYDLKKIVSSSHALPKDLLEEAKTVVAYFIPFDDEVAKSNIEGRECSKKWGQAYIETNRLILDLNIHVQEKLKELGYKSNIIPATHNFDEEKLISDWSHRHVAYIAGLGTFGINNMLITDKGTCGRVGTFVTDLKIESTKRKDKENCLYKHSKICKKCVKRCVNDALKIESFDRHKCYEMCLYNDKFHSDMGLVDVCGKCLVGVPCATCNPLNSMKWSETL